MPTWQTFSRTARADWNLQRLHRKSPPPELKEKISTKRCVTQLGINKRNLQRIVVKDLYLFPCKMHQQVLSADRQSHVNYSNAILNLNNELKNLKSKIIINGGAHFYLSGYFNQGKPCIWGSASTVEECYFWVLMYT